MRLAHQHDWLQFLPLTAARLDQIVRVEQQAHEHPWTRRHFADTLVAGYQGQVLCSADDILGYFVAMQGVDEVHLLNITVAPAHQGQGWGRMLLDALVIWARAQGAKWLWLEARVSNARALHVYQSFGLKPVGERKDYYPANPGQREHAVVMSLQL
ncbi:MAG: ribosomal protein S18-alanine N-acetyltransferase [Betaproteobacteria bacterium]